MSFDFGSFQIPTLPLTRPGAQGSEPSYVRGALVAYTPRTYNTPKATQGRRVIPFRFNPESLTRSVSVEGAQHQAGVEGAQAGAPGGAHAAAPASAETSADQANGSLKETFTIQIRLDFADRDASASGLDPKLGVAPEIAAIEDLLYPAETNAERTAAGGTSGVHTARERPTVLFVWGTRHVVPVRIASLKIDESVYNADLYPVRAEIEASLEVLGQADAANDAAVQAGLSHTDQARRDLASKYYATTSAQAYSKIFPL